MYTSTWGILVDRLNTSRCIQLCIQHCLHSNSSQQSWKPANPNSKSRSKHDQPKSTANGRCREESETQAVVIVTACGVYSSISGLRQSQHPSIWSHIHDASSSCNGLTHGALHVEQTADYECKRLGCTELYNTMSCESITWSPTFVDNRDVLEHPNAAKQHIVHCIRGTHKGHLERGILNQQPMLDITCSSQHQDRVQVFKTKSDLIQSASDDRAEL